MDDKLVERVARAVFRVERVDGNSAMVPIADLRALLAALTTTADDALRDDAELLCGIATAIREGRADHMGDEYAERLERIASRLRSPTK